MVLRVLIVFLLAACSPSKRNIRIYSDATGSWQTVSRDTEVFRDGEDHISARTIVLQKTRRSGIICLFPCCVAAQTAHTCAE